MGWVKHALSRLSCERCEWAGPRTLELAGPPTFGVGWASNAGNRPGRECRCGLGQARFEWAGPRRWTGLGREHGEFAGPLTLEFSGPRTMLVGWAAIA